MIYVIDASVAASLFLPDEEEKTATTLLEGLGEEDRLLVPPLFWHEITSILEGALRKGRLAEGPAFRALEMMRRVGFQVDGRAIEETAPSIFMLAREHGLSSYDATYLELAAREGAVLASHDGELREAARKSGLRVLPAA